MKDCSPSVAPIVTGDRFNLNQCPKNELEREQSVLNVIRYLPYSLRKVKKKKV